MEVRRRALPIKSLNLLEQRAQAKVDQLVSMGSHAIERVVLTAKPHKETYTVAGQLGPMEKSVQGGEFESALKVPTEEAKRTRKEDFVILSLGEKRPEEEQADFRAATLERERNGLWTELFTRYRQDNLSTEAAGLAVLKDLVYQQKAEAAKAAARVARDVHDREHAERERYRQMWVQAREKAQTTGEKIPKGYKELETFWEQANSEDIPTR